MAVTCIQFNPLDDNYFLSGSLDAKIRLWDIPDRKVVDWTELHEMVTAACYTPDGQVQLPYILVFQNLSFLVSCTLQHAYAYNLHMKLNQLRKLHYDFC